MKTIGFIGAGNMAFALTGAFCHGVDALRVALYDPSVERQILFQDNFSFVKVADNISSLIECSDIIFLAVKPQIIPVVLLQLESVQIPVVSIVAGITLTTLEEAMPLAPVVRVMPNTPCLVGEMAGAAVFGKQVTDTQRGEVLQLLALAGTIITVNEEQMNIVTGLSGSGPAFVARLIESFIIAGKEGGLSEADATALTLATFTGTAQLLRKKKMTPETLVTMVSSPNGTTIAGRAILETSNYQNIIKETIKTAALRSQELGK